MLRLLLRIALTLAGDLTVQDAAATPQCEVPGRSWECIGVVEIRVAGQTLRMSRFSNDELLAEVESPAISKRLFVAQPSGTELYFGLSRQELSHPGENPFLFFDYAFALPVGALRAAFPDGPGSVPVEEAQRSVTVSGKVVSISATQLSSSEVAFRLEASNLGPISGRFSIKRLEPLPESHSTIGWESKTGTRFGSLRDAR